METIANYLGNYKLQDVNSLREGPIIISSNNYYAWGDLLTFRYIGEKTFSPQAGHHTDHDVGGGLHQPIGAVLPGVVYAPIHLRYHTISQENPVTIIQDTAEPVDEGQALIVLKSTPKNAHIKYLEIEDHSSEDNVLEVFINVVESSQEDDSWLLTKERKFPLSMEPLLMFVMTTKSNPLKATVMIIEASPSYDQNLPAPSDVSLETFVQNFVDQIVDAAVDSSTNN